MMMMMCMMTGQVYSTGTGRGADTSSKGTQQASGQGKKSKPSASDELDDIVVDLDDDDEPPASRNSGSRLLGFSLGFGNKPKTEMVQAPTGHAKPEHLEGWLEKKRPGKVSLGSDWQRRYIRIDEHSSSLVYYKTSKYVCLYPHDLNDRE